MAQFNLPSHGFHLMWIKSHLTSLALNQWGNSYEPPNINYFSTMYHPQHQIRISKHLHFRFHPFANKYNYILSLQQPGLFGEKTSTKLCKKRPTNVRYKSPKCGKAFATWFCYLFIYLLHTVFARSWSPPRWIAQSSSC